jgi:hypothetical protein
MKVKQCPALSIYRPGKRSNTLSPLPISPVLWQVRRSNPAILTENTLSDASSRREPWAVAERVRFPNGPLGKVGLHAAGGELGLNSRQLLEDHPDLAAELESYFRNRAAFEEFAGDGRF